MKQISNKEYEKYQQYLTDQLHGRTLTPCFCFLVTKCLHTSIDKNPMSDYNVSIRCRILYKGDRL